MGMEKREIIFRVTLQLDEKWAGRQTQEEVVDYLEARLNSSLGFRGAIKKLKVMKERKKAAVVGTDHILR